MIIHNFRWTPTNNKGSRGKPVRSTIFSPFKLFRAWITALKGATLIRHFAMSIMMKKVRHMIRARVKVHKIFSLSTVGWALKMTMMKNLLSLIEISKEIWTRNVRGWLLHSITASKLINLDRLKMLRQRIRRIETYIQTRSASSKLQKCPLQWILAPPLVASSMRATWMRWIIL